MGLVTVGFVIIQMVTVGFVSYGLAVIELVVVGFVAFNEIFEDVQTSCERT